MSAADNFIRCQNCSEGIALNKIESYQLVLIFGSFKNRALNGMPIPMKSAFSKLTFSQSKIVIDIVLHSKENIERYQSDFAIITCSQECRNEFLSTFIIEAPGKHIFINRAN